MSRQYVGSDGYFVDGSEIPAEIAERAWQNVLKVKRLHSQAPNTFPHVEDDSLSWTWTSKPGKPTGNRGLLFVYYDVDNGRTIDRRGAGYTPAELGL